MVHPLFPMISHRNSGMMLTVKLPPARGLRILMEGHVSGMGPAASASNLVAVRVPRRRLFSELWEAPKVCWSAYFSRPTWRRRIHDFGGFNMFQPHMCSYLYMKRMTILNPNIWNIMMELSEDTGKS